MNNPPQLTPKRVYDLVMANRVVEAQTCHIHEKGFKFQDDVIPALMGASRVERDRRSAHPDGWVAFAPHYGGKVVRVDFNREILEDGEMLLVVTMMEVTG